LRHHSPYEEFVRGSVTEALAMFADWEVKGEVVLLVASGE